ncbi:uncharacterized protein LOC135806405 [Sycon ciliatum]|uniref:uncharacterized protein LOC135806405 n=1 Tax=Sycon ciliatum TaxID=27933 RepID=UPI0031F633FE
MAAYMGILYEFGRLAHFRGYCCCGGVDYNKWDELCAERRSAEGCLVHRSGYCCCHFKAKFSEDVPSIAAELSKALDQDQRTSESNLPPSSAVGVEGNHDGDNNAAPRVDPGSNADAAAAVRAPVITEQLPASPRTKTQRWKPSTMHGDCAYCGIAGDNETSSSSEDDIHAPVLSNASAAAVPMTDTDVVTAIPADAVPAWFMSNTKEEAGIDPIGSSSPIPLSPPSSRSNSPSPTSGSTGSDVSDEEADIGASPTAEYPVLYSEQSVQGDSPLLAQKSPETAVSDAAADLPVRVSSTESDNDDRPTLVTCNTSSEQQSQLAYADRDYCPPSDVHTRETGDQSEPASPHEVPTELSTEGLWETIRKLEKIISENRYQDMRQTQTKVGEQEVIERRTKDLIRETSEVREEKGKLGALLEKVQRDEAVWNIMNSTLRTEIEAAVGVHRTNPSLDPTEAFQETELAEQPADAPVLQVVGSSMPKNVETDMRDATSKPATWQGNKHQEHQPRVISNAVGAAVGPLGKFMFTVATARSSFGLDILQAENVSEALSSGTASDSLDT